MWYWNFARTCNTIRSLLLRRMNQIEPNKSSYLENKKRCGIETLHAHVTQLDLYCLGEWTKSNWYFLRKCRKPPILTPFCPISREPEFSWTWNLVHVCITIRPSFSVKTSKILTLVFEKTPKTPIFDPLWPHISRTRFFLNMKFGTRMYHYKTFLLCENERNP